MRMSPDFGRLLVLAVFVIAAVTASPSHAVSTLPCPSVGAQSPSTVLLAAGQDNACENWVTTRTVNQPGANVASANLSRVLLAGNLDGADLHLANMQFLETPICPGLSAKNANFSSADLRSARLVCSDFAGANFSNADLRGARSDYVFGANYAGALFTGADLTDFVAQNSTFDDATFAGAILLGTTFIESFFARTDFTGRSFVGGQFLGGNLSDAIFVEADLTAVPFTNYNSNRPMRLDRTDFSFATMTAVQIVFARDAVGTLFTQADLSLADLLTSFSEADFSGANLFRAQLGGACLDCLFVGASLIETDLGQATLFGADLTGATMSAGTILAGARYDATTVFPSGATFVGPTWGLPGGLSPSASGMIADFSGNDVSGMNLAGFQLPNVSMGRLIARGTNFSNANLSGVTLVGADLTGANLAGANLSGAVLTDALYDEATVFPSGGSYAQKPWGLPGGQSPWALRMKPVPEPSWLAGVAAGLVALAGLAAPRSRAPVRRSPHPI